MNFRQTPKEVMDEIINKERKGEFELSKDEFLNFLFEVIRPTAQKDSNGYIRYDVSSLIELFVNRTDRSQRTLDEQVWLFVEPKEYGDLFNLKTKMVTASINNESENTPPIMLTESGKEKMEKAYGDFIERIGEDMYYFRYRGRRVSVI